jgi:hypothetical protein
MLNTKHDYEYIRDNNQDDWQRHWLNLLDGRWIVRDNELVEDPNAKIFRIGFTVTEVELAVGHSGYTSRQLDWYASQPDRFHLIDEMYVQVDGWAEEYEAMIQAKEQEATIARMKQALQKHLDDTALTREYDNIVSLCSYANSLDPVFRAEGEAGVIFRDAVWLYAKQVMVDVLGGLRDIPTEEELISELPTIDW